MTRPTDPDPNALDAAVSRWLDGECGADEARRVEARVAADPALAEEVARLRSAMDAFRDDASAAAPEALAERVLASAARGEQESEQFRGLARRYAAAAAVLLAVGVGGSVWVAPAASSASAQRAGTASLVDLEESQMARELYVALDEQPVGGR